MTYQSVDMYRPYNTQHNMYMFLPIVLLCLYIDIRSIGCTDSASIMLHNYRTLYGKQVSMKLISEKQYEDALTSYLRNPSTPPMWTKHLQEKIIHIILDSSLELTKAFDKLDQVFVRILHWCDTRRLQSKKFEECEVSNSCYVIKVDTYMYFL